MTGNPRCPECNGRGGTFRHGRFYVCPCTRITNAGRAAQRADSLRDVEAFRRVQEQLRKRAEEE